MPEHIHDCVVVGAGPAGSAAALLLARAGADIVLLERGNRPGEKNVMSGVLVTDKLFELVPDFEQHAPLQRRIISAYDQNVLSETQVLRLPCVRDYGSDDIPYYTVFRSQFDAWFAQQAVDAGAELFTATRVDDLLWEGDRVAGVRTRRGDLRARVVIGADGVNSTVAEQSGLLGPPEAGYVSLIVRQILDLPAETIEERFALRPGEGILSLYIGLVTGPTGAQSTYYTEMYTNHDSLTMSVEIPLDALIACGVPVYDVLAAREQHPYIARLIQGATLREYQAHLIPWGGLTDLGRLVGNGLLLAGDAGRFVNKDGVGSFPAMASGAAAARTVLHALEKGDSTRPTLLAYLDQLDQEGMLESQREARESWDYRRRQRAALDQLPPRMLHVAERIASGWIVREEEHVHSLWDEIYHNLVKPLAPWTIRGPLGLVTWFDALLWRHRRT